MADPVQATRDGSFLARLSIRVTIPALLALPTVLACILLIALATHRARTAVDRIVLDNFASTHERIWDRIDDMISKPQRVNDLNVQLIRSGRLDLANLASWRTIFRQEAGLFDIISCLSWDGADGRHAWIARYPGSRDLYFAVNNDATSRNVVERPYKPDGTLADEPQRSYDIDPREFAPFKTGAAAKSNTWAEPFNWVSEDGSLLTRALANVTPVRDAQGKLLGVLTAQFTLHDISDFLSHEVPSPGSRIFVLDTQGYLLADSHGRSILDEQRNPVVAARSTDPVIAAATAQLRLNPADRAAFQTRQKMLVDLRGEPWLLVATPFSQPAGLNWIIVTCAPEEDFLADLQQARRDGAIAAIGIAAATILFGLYLTSITLRPMLDLKTYLRRLGEGELDARITLPYAREFLQIADALNRMAESLKAHLKLKQDVAVADEVQKSLLPAAIPNFPGIELAAFSRYCDKTGGDYYDFLEFQGGDREMVIAVGDVMGHGLPAAMLMATTRGILRSRSDSTRSPADMLNHANRHILGDGDMNAGRFMTLLLLSITDPPHRIRFASAGHDMPIVYCPATQSFTKIEGGDLPLGILADTQYLDHAVPALPAGAILVLATDGLWDTRNPERVALGKERVCATIRDNAERPAADILRALQTLADNHRGQSAMEDDLTMVVIKLLPG